MNNATSSLAYLLVTPARNEEAFIEATIKSMINQTWLPKRWVIVSDGSTDRTDDIIRSYANKHEWIEYVRRPEHADRHFAAKVQCFNAGFEKVRQLDYDIIGNLDADITFENDYFAFLMNKFAAMPELGVAGTPFVEAQGGDTYDYRFVNQEHVSGACQLFRKECFEQIGGYTPIKGGAIDWVAVTTARMKGWKTQTFIDKTCLHHRKIGTGGANMLHASYKQGQKDYYTGGHPLWEVFRALYQAQRKPYLIGGILLLAGYVIAFIMRMERPVSHELIGFNRREQMQRLRTKIAGATGLKFFK